jgi:hypothetical protein
VELTRRTFAGGFEPGYHWMVQAFASARDAKEFLASRIVAEAQREGSPLSEVERKMLYFSETAWTLPDIMEVNDTFDREYDQAVYEKKIAKLIRKIRASARADNQDESDAWTEAVHTLGREDHYILVLIGAAGGSVRPRGDVLKLLAAALAIAAIIIVVAFFAASR